MLNRLIEAMKRAIHEVRQWPDKAVQIFHHNDADGLCSGVILTRAFERKGFEVRRFCLEKPYPAVLEKIYQQKGRILIFADFAGRIAPMLSKLNMGRNLTLILDHHAAEASTDPKVHNLDPELYGLKGDRDISASTTCFLFARTMDSANQDMAHIAAIGAVGDKFFVNGRLASQNREVTMEAVQQGMVEIREHETGEWYFVKFSGGMISCDELGAYLNTLGTVGFYQNGPDMGIKVCLEGVSPESDQMVKALRAIQKKAFDEEIAKIQGGALKKMPHIQWFHVENRFSPMMIGDFCDAIKNKEYLDSRRYLAGFQIIQNDIPGFGPITLNGVKISMRVSAYMEGKIKAGRAMGLNILLPQATNRLGGFSDACHSLTGATTVDMGKEEELIREMEKILGAEKEC